MGSGLFGCCPSLTITLILLVLLASLVTAFSNCKVDLCSRHYAHAIETGQVPRGPTFSYCRILRRYAECLTINSRTCRGSLEYHSITTLVMQWNNELNCSHIVSQGQLDLTLPHTPPTVDRRVPVRVRPTVPEECTFHGRISGYSHCGLFGDPHLMTFGKEYQTCRVLGAWPLIDNPYLAVQVTNEAVREGSGATATSKVTVIIRDHGPCTKEKTYEAQSDSLPGVFIDGTRSSNPDRSVRIKEENPGRHIEIIIRHIATRIIIRLVGRHLTFAIRTPNEVANLGSHGTSLELCARGCPKRERIDHVALLASSGPSSQQWLGHSPAVTLDEAVTTCRRFNVTDFYFDACVFDLMTTGDSSFSRAAENAAKDIVSLNPAMASSENRTYLLQTDVIHRRPSANSAPGRTQPPLLVLIVLLACLSAWRQF